MSTPTPVLHLLAKLAQVSETISAAYYQGSVHRTEENFRDIERLRQLRLLAPGLQDTYQLRGSFRQFLNGVLSTERLFAMGANIGGFFERLEYVADAFVTAFEENREEACDRYAVDLREAVSDIADAIEDELVVLQTQVATKFGAVATIAEKRKQNVFYLNRTQQLVNLLENLHFAEIGHRLSVHEEVLAAYNGLLGDRVPAFRESLLGILRTLNQYLFEFRQIEERSRKLRTLALHFNRHPDWEPSDLAEAPEPEGWLMTAAPLSVTGSPDVDAPESRKDLEAIARTIPASVEMRQRESRSQGTLDGDDGPEDIQSSPPPLRRVVRLFYRAAQESEDGISALEWRRKNPEHLPEIGNTLWLLRVLAENDAKGRAAPWLLKMVTSDPPLFNGNLLIHDVVVSKRVR